MMENSLYSASQVQASSAPSGDLLGGLGRSSTPVPGATSGASASNGTFDAIIAIGVLIKGETAHFEYISQAVSTGLMRIQLDFGVPVVFGVLVCIPFYLAD
jgi:6,7-dimethyl-8-ribityllumazine synthase